MSVSDGRSTFRHPTSSSRRRRDPLNGGVKNSLNWARASGATYQLNEKTVIRGGYGRSYDIGVFGSIFGHTVTQNLPVLSVQRPERRERLRRRLQSVAAGAGPGLHGRSAERTVPAARRRLHARAAGQAAARRPSTPTTSRFSARSAPDVRRGGYVGNHGARVVRRRRPGPERQPADARPAFRNACRRISGRPYLQLGYGWTQGIDASATAGRTATTRSRRKLTKRFANGYSVFARTRCSASGSTMAASSSTCRISSTGRRAGIAFTASRYRRCGSCRSSQDNRFLGGWQFNQNTIIQSGVPFDVSYRDAGQDRDTGPNRPNLIGDPDGPQTRDQWFNTAPIGDPNSAFGRPAKGTFGNLAKNSLWGPGLLADRRVALQEVQRRQATTKSSSGSRPSTSSTTSTSATPTRRSACRATTTPTPAGSTRRLTATPIRNATSSLR